MEILFNPDISKDLGMQEALFEGYTHRMCMLGPRNITAKMVQEDLGMNYEAFLRCRRRLVAKKLIKEALDSKGFLYIAMPNQSFPFEAKPTNVKRTK